MGKNDESRDAGGISTARAVTRVGKQDGEGRLRPWGFRVIRNC